MMIIIRKTLLLVVLVALLMISIVSADELQGFVGESTTISTVCIRNSQIRANATVVVSIFDEVGALIYGPVNSTSGGNGTFSTSYVFQNTGKYATKETCDFGDYLADGSTAISIIKPVFGGSMQVMAQSIGQVRLNRAVQAEWLLLLPNSTGSSNSTIVAEAASCFVSDLNNTQMNITLSPVVEVDRLAVAFDANSGYGFMEDNNYQILCNLNLSSGLYVNGIKNYFYVNPHLTFLQFLGQILGIVEQTQTIANQTLSISNQTLQIVSNLNVSNASIVIDIKNDTSAILDILNDANMYIIS